MASWLWGECNSLSTRAYDHTSESNSQFKNDVQASAIQSHILNDLRVCTRLKLEEHDVCD